ncbi:hypothetical protein cyc_03175 [Cyclospora cayetanensis]|uniref:Uncharacterized protein n=1 Tax=Cyclospora cayetanensis TaxID=88456 RepID=A0A1D3D9J9_9EIME|nr:hypothetical protein cyc_03175 [Cyclospora cayetanensis]
MGGEREGLFGQDGADDSRRNGPFASLPLFESLLQSPCGRYAPVGGASPRNVAAGSPSPAISVAAASEVRRVLDSGACSSSRSGGTHGRCSPPGGGGGVNSSADITLRPLCIATAAGGMGSADTAEAVVINSNDLWAHQTSGGRMKKEKALKQRREEQVAAQIRLKEGEAHLFGIRSPWRIVRSRFYVTSASHVEALLNVLLLSHSAVACKPSNGSPAADTTHRDLNQSAAAAAAAKAADGGGACETGFRRGRRSSFSDSNAESRLPGGTEEDGGAEGDAGRKQFKPILDHELRVMLYSARQLWREVHQQEEEEARSAAFPPCESQSRSGRSPLAEGAQHLQNCTACQSREGKGEATSRSSSTQQKSREAISGVEAAWLCPGGESCRRRPSLRPSTPGCSCMKTYANRVPPYCEIAPLLPLGRSIEVGDFEALMNEVLRRYGDGIPQRNRTDKSKPHEEDGNTRGTTQHSVSPGAVAKMPTLNSVLAHSWASLSEL